MVNSELAVRDVSVHVHTNLQCRALTWLDYVLRVATLLFHCSLRGFTALPLERQLLWICFGRLITITATTLNPARQLISQRPSSMLSAGAVCPAVCM